MTKSTRPRHLRVLFAVAVCLVGALAATVAIASAATTPKRSAATTEPRAKAADAAQATAAATSKTGMYEADSTQAWLAIKQKAAQRFVTASSTPGSKTFRHFLSPSGYTRRFGPSAAQVKTVKSYLKSKGFTQIKVSTNDNYVSGIAPKSDHSTLKIPASLRHDVLTVTGRNDAQVKANIADKGAITSTRATTMNAAATPPIASAAATTTPSCSQYWGQHTQSFSPAFDGVTEAATRGCGYSAKQLRRAYGLTSSDTGKGETIALIQVGGPISMRRALGDYAKQNGLAPPKAGQYRQRSIDGGLANSSCADGAYVEASQDSEAAYAMAPAAKQIMVDGDDCDGNDSQAQAVLDAMLAPLVGHGQHPSASIENVCYEISRTEAGETGEQLKATHAVALRAAAEGVSLLAASGDDLGVGAPALDPDVTAVGGTTLGIGTNGQRLFETGWATRSGERKGTTGAWTTEGSLVGAGGGVSTHYQEPGYQRGVVPNAMAGRKDGSTGRAVPDISADADPDTGMLVGVFYSKHAAYTTLIGSGTSMATPLIAGIVADAEHGHSERFGFLNPLFYSLAASKAINDVLPLTQSTPQVDRAVYSTGDADIHGKWAPGEILHLHVNAAKKQTTARGYDTITGLGTPNGNAFIQALRSGR